MLSYSPCTPSLPIAIVSTYYVYKHQHNIVVRGQVSELRVQCVASLTLCSVEYICELVSCIRRCPRSTAWLLRDWPNSLDSSLVVVATNSSAYACQIAALTATYRQRLLASNSYHDGQQCVLDWFARASKRCKNERNSIRCDYAIRRKAARASISDNRHTEKSVWQLQIPHTMRMEHFGSEFHSRR
jgi:hypothetical protein